MRSIGASGRAALIAAAVLVAAFSASGGAATPAAQLTVEYSGAQAVGNTISARVPTTPARVAAVTFSVDGKPLATDTTAPYEADVTGLLSAGAHVLRIQAVDVAGDRARSAPVTVTVAPTTTAITASPSHNLGAALATLARGHATVRLAPGRYDLTQLRLGDGARLVGAGPSTTITAPRSSPYWALVLVPGTRNVSVSNLSIDAGGPGGGAGEAISIQSGASGVTVRHVRIANVRRYGVVAWGAHSNVSVQDSRITGNGRAEAGVMTEESQASSGTSVIRTRISHFRRWGINFAQGRYHLANAGTHALALDNVISNVYDPASSNGTDEGGIWSGVVGASIVGNRISRTGWDGIETVGSSDRVTVVGNRISRTRYGIYLEHSTNDSVFRNNSISHVSWHGLMVELGYGGVASVRNTFQGNRIAFSQRAGIQIDPGADANRVFGNSFVAGGADGILLQGSSHNVISGNRGCAGQHGPLVHERTGLWLNNAPALPVGNLVSANAMTPDCS